MMVNIFSRNFSHFADNIITLLRTKGGLIWPGKQKFRDNMVKGESHEKKQFSKNLCIFSNLECLEKHIKNVVSYKGQPTCGKN